MATELGKVANLLATAEHADTPLQQRLARVSRTLLVMCLGIVVVTAVVGLARGRAVLEVFMSAVSLAVAAVPRGFPPSSRSRWPSGSSGCPNATS
jgi:Ca2+-transporting ATPase